MREGEEGVADAWVVAGREVVEGEGEWLQRRTLKRGRELRPRALQWERSLEEVGGVAELVEERQ